MWQFSPSQSLPSLLSPQPPTLEERWEGEWATECEWLPCGTVSLEATDEGVVGHYLNGTGSLHGVVDGDRLVGVWLLGGASGTFEFVMSDQANTFNGMWDDRWQWCGAQEGVPLPAQCAQPIQ